MIYFSLLFFVCLCVGSVQSLHCPWLPAVLIYCTTQTDSLLCQKATNRIIIFAGSSSVSPTFPLNCGESLFFPACHSHFDKSPLVNAVR